MFVMCLCENEGGYSNSAFGDYATVFGGEYNVADGEAAVIGGGDSNTAEGQVGIFPVNVFAVASVVWPLTFLCVAVVCGHLEWYTERD